MSFSKLYQIWAKCMLTSKSKKKKILHKYWLLVECIEGENVFQITASKW